MRCAVQQKNYTLTHGNGAKYRAILVRILNIRATKRHNHPHIVKFQDLYNGRHLLQNYDILRYRKQ